MSFRLPDIPGPSSSISSLGLSRKRTLSRPEEFSATKRPRLSTSSLSFSSEYEPWNDLDRLSRAPSHLDRSHLYEERPLISRRPRLLSASSSFSALSPSTHSDADEALSEGLALIRSASVGSLDFRSSSPSVPAVPEASARNHMRIGKVAVDFSVSAEDATAGHWPVSWSLGNVLVFGRGNRVHCKNLTSNEDIAQLCKIRDVHGDLRLLDCGGKDQPNMVAVSTTKGYIQLWDITAKKMTFSWQTTGVAAIRWNGPILTVGGHRGAIRHYDTRINPSAKMKEQAKKVTRHQARIASLAWNIEGRLLASGDESGLVYCWDSRQNAPLDVGEMIQRRRKMQHVGPAGALAWCPWNSKILASGDSAPDKSGTIRIWNVNTSSATHDSSNRLEIVELDAQVTSLHFSPHCKELLSTHGPGKTTPVPQHYDPASPVAVHFPTEPQASRISNSVVVHSYPSMRHVATLSASAKNIAGSLLSPNGQKIVLAVPEESKLKIWDVWGKPKELRRQPSALSVSGRIR